MKLGRSERDEFDVEGERKAFGSASTAPDIDIVSGQTDAGVCPSQASVRL